MNDALNPQPSTSAPERELTPAEIDARHAHHLVERALSQLERGERNEAALACKQAIHLAPNAPYTHAVAGLLALLEQDVPGARAAYEKAVVDFSKASPERERLIALRMAQADNTPVDVTAFIPNLPNEILRLRQALQTASPQAFLHTNENGVVHAPASKAVAAATTIPATPPPLMLPDDLDRPAFASRLERRRRASTWAVAAAGISAAIVSFFVVRALVGPQQLPAPIAPSPPAANQVVEETPPQTSPAPAAPAGSPAANGTTDAGGTAPAPTAPTPTPTPTTTVTTRPVTPRVTPNPRPAAQPTPRPTPRSDPGAPTVPPSTPRTSPTPRPTPRPTPADPVFPEMPSPRVTLPSAGGERPDFPRVLPDND